ncbi:DNA topoisomerase 2-beta [Dermatophagoides farinae]|uniref:DNA topoisomerase 2 n=1 Tax=Dermatophagoides farinae TaxID=6954 RepID=A0A922L1G5_DERFA|nr:DNA topoisomerase 2-beta [Dermatophagoides farinae]
MSSMSNESDFIDEDESDFEDETFGVGGSKTNKSKATTSKKQQQQQQNGKQQKKRQSIERIYQKKTQLEHILLRPDTYIGSVEKETKQMWIWDKDEDKMVFREITYVPGLYKIFDEILVNAADNKQRDKSMNCIRIDIDVDGNEITIYNNGKGIPVIEHKTEKCYVPTLIFGHLLTSSNYNDEEKKVVGGRNGFGAKLCNIFSTKFQVETSCKEYHKSFLQIWNDNMKDTKDPKISTNATEDFTRITFQPDLSKFKMNCLDKDIVALFSRRAYDVAGSTRGVKVFLNGKKLPISGFKEYVELFVKDRQDEIGNNIKVVHENVNDRWEIAATVSNNGFQQISFVNSIATTRGGKHVDHVSDQIVNKVTEVIKKKNKVGIAVKPFQIRNHLWVFVNCLIENPTFDSQTKETMTLQVKSFGSTCSPADKFFNNVFKVGIVEAVLSWAKFKAQTELSKKCHSKKYAKLTGIPKLEDANDAGTKNSIDCTLILTEGDSAKSLVVAGLGVVGRDKYGVFPLRGKMLNVREASHKQILENAEINNIIKIVGLQYKKQYQSIDDLKTLRYGKLMIMTDQDQDGSHIKGLLINFIHHNWPSLLKLNFLEQFITPIVKASKGNEVHSFYSLPEFEEWKKSNPNWLHYKIKYYKGLGTSTSAEAKEYFTEMERHRIKFHYSGHDDDHFVQLAFSKKMVEQRKEWLTNSLEERKRRRELGLPEMYLYEKNTRNITYKDFVNKELILFSNMDNERSIPSLVDGLKPGQRKVLYTCFKRNDKREVKVAQLAGSVGEHSAYHHGEVSLMSTIINLAQNFVGSNNINLLQPLGQFGTRLQGGKDAASPRYIFTMLSTLARKLFPQLDDPLLNYLYDDNLKIEPEYYVPIIPTVLVNGAEGIGTGWSTKIPNYNPREIVDNIRRLMHGREIRSMKPWFKGFNGTIEQIDTQRFVINGEAAILDNGKSFEITELPIRVWTQTYKETVLEPMLNGTEKSPPFIQDYKEYHTDATVKFVITLSEENLQKALNNGLHKTFKIQTSMSTTTMVLFDHLGCLKKYETPEEILQEFYPVRLEYYAKRKAYYEGILEAETLKLENQARFILEKNDRILIMENIKKKDFITTLVKRNYDSDPVKAWKKKNSDKDEESDKESDDGDEYPEKRYNFDYLIDMSMRSMLREKVDELLKQRDHKKQELEKLRLSTLEDLWEEDLRQFLDELDHVEQFEREQLESGNKLKLKMKHSSKVSSRPVKKQTFNGALNDYKPSPDGERIVPKIDSELLRKTNLIMNKKQQSSLANNNNVEKLSNSDKPVNSVEMASTNNNVIAIDSDSENEYIPLAQRIGVSPELVDKKKALTSKRRDENDPPTITTTTTTTTTLPKSKKSNNKKTKENGDASKSSAKSTKTKSNKKKSRNPWSDDDLSEDNDDEMELDLDDDDDDDFELNVRHVQPKTKKSKSEITTKNSIETMPVATQPPVTQQQPPPPQRTFADSDEDDELLKPPKQQEQKKTSEELFDSIFTSSFTSSTSNEPPKSTNGTIKSATMESNNNKNDDRLFDDDDDDDIFQNDKRDDFVNAVATAETIKTTKKVKKTTKKQKLHSEDDDDDDDDDKEDDSNSSDFVISAASKKTKSKKATTAGGNKTTASKKTAAKTKKKKRILDSESDDFDDDDDFKTSKKKTKKNKLIVIDESFNDEIPPEFRTKTGRIRQPVNYNYDNSSDEEY